LLKKVANRIIFMGEDQAIKESTHQINNLFTNPESEYLQLFLD